MDFLLVIAFAIIASAIAFSGRDNMPLIFIVIVGFLFGGNMLYTESVGNSKMEGMEHYIQNTLYPEELVIIGVSNDSPSDIYTNNFIVQTQNGTEEVEVTYVKSINGYTHNKKQQGNTVVEKSEVVVAEETKPSADRQVLQDEEYPESEVERFIKEKVFSSSTDNIQLNKKSVDDSKKHIYYARKEGKLYEVIVIPDAEFSDYLYELNPIDFE